MTDEAPKTTSAPSQTSEANETEKTNEDQIGWSLCRSEEELNDPKTQEYMQDRILHEMFYDGKKLVVVWPGEPCTEEMRNRKAAELRKGLPGVSLKNVTILMRHTSGTARKEATKKYEEMVRAAIADGSLLIESKRDQLEKEMPFVYVLQGDDGEAHKCYLQRHKYIFESPPDVELEQLIKTNIERCLDDVIVPPKTSIKFEHRPFSKELVKKGELFRSVWVPITCYRYWLHEQVARMRQREAAKKPAESAPAAEKKAKTPKPTPTPSEGKKKAKKTATDKKEDADVEMADRPSKKSALKQMQKPDPVDEGAEEEDMDYDPAQQESSDKSDEDDYESESEIGPEERMTKGRHVIEKVYRGVVADSVPTDGMTLEEVPAENMAEDKVKMLASAAFNKLHVPYDKHVKETNLDKWESINLAASSKEAPPNVAFLREPSSGNASSETTAKAAPKKQPLKSKPAMEKKDTSSKPAKSKEAAALKAAEPSKQTAKKTKQSEKAADTEKEPAKHNESLLRQGLNEYISIVRAGKPSKESNEEFLKGFREQKGPCVLEKYEDLSELRKPDASIDDKRAIAQVGHTLARLLDDHDAFVEKTVQKRARTKLMTELEKFDAEFAKRFKKRRTAPAAAPAPAAEPAFDPFA